MPRRAAAQPSQPVFPLRPGLLLVLAAFLVGLAIVVGGPLGRVVNGAGGLLWVGAAVLLARQLAGARRPWLGIAIVAVVIALLVLAVRPGDIVAAAVGFTLGGALVALIAADRSIVWALLMAAAWLPGHIALRVGLSALADQARVRADPPPTAALVPLTMVVAASVGGLLVAQLRRRRLGPATPPVAFDSSAD